MDLTEFIEMFLTITRETNKSILPGTRVGQIEITFSDERFNFKNLETNSYLEKQTHQEAIKILQDILVLVVPRKLDTSSIEVSGIDFDDCPDFCDAYISYAQWKDGTPLTDDELDDLNEDRDLVYKSVQNSLY